MILPGDGWKFAEGLGDRGFFEEEIVEHFIGKHSAFRRVFSEQFCKDQGALAAVLWQIEKSGPVSHPQLAQLFGFEMIEDRLAITSERIVGMRLDQFVMGNPIRRPGAWMAMAGAVARMLRELQRQSVAFDRLLLENIVICDEMLRISTRWPLGTITPEQLKSSPFLQRLIDSPYGGVYASDGDYPLARGMTRLKNLLFYIASGQTERNVSDTIAANQEEARRGGHVGRSMLSLEVEIDRVIMRMHDPDAQGGIRTLDDLLAALDRPASSSRSVRLPDIPPPAAPAAEAPRPPMRSSGEIPLPGPPPPAPTPQEAQETEKKLRAVSREMIAKVLDESPNQEDVDTLYPQRPHAAPPKGGSGAAALPPKSIRIGGWLPSRMVLLAAGAVGIVVVLGAIAATLFQPKPNLPPTAVIAAVPAEIEFIRPLALDGSRSTDPEGVQLQYTWSVVEPPKTDVRFSVNLTADAAHTEVQFFQSGRHRIQLQVFDGATSSPPATVDVIVRDRR